jgi:alkylhydroperoxidase family enzyme
MSCHAEFLRVALDGDDRLSRAVLGELARLGDACTTSRQRALVELVTIVTLAPWTLSRAHHRSATAAGLTDDDILHAIALSAYFGHLNRIADAVAVQLDYAVQLPGLAADATTSPMAQAPDIIAGRHAIELSKRPATATALADWRSYLIQKDQPITRRQRTLIVRWVANWLGDGGISSPSDVTANPLDATVCSLAETVTLAPWQLSDASFEALRRAGFDDAALFDICATASAAGLFSRLEVSLVALGS